MIFTGTVDPETAESAYIESELVVLRGRLERTQRAFVGAVMERNFFQRAMADLDFHNNTQDGILYFDIQKRVVYANPHFVQMMEIEDSTGLLNKPLPRTMWADPDEEETLFRDVRQNGFVREREMHLFNRRSEPVFVLGSAVISKDDDGNLIGTELLLNNVTAHRKFQVDLVQRSRQLEQQIGASRLLLDRLLEVVQRGASLSDLDRLLQQLRQELDKTG